IVQLIIFIVDSGCTKHMTGNLKLCNFVKKFLGTVRFGNDQFAPILRYGDLVQGNITINRVYYVEGLNYNLFSVGQFCDADLEGNDLLTGNRGSDLSMISLQESTSSTPLCLMAKALPTQAWLWHRRLSHFNFDYINLLSKKDIVIGLPKLKYVKDQLCSSCEYDIRVNKRQMQMHASKVDSSKALDADLVVMKSHRTEFGKQDTSSNLGNYLTYVVDADIIPHHTEQSEPIYDTYLLEKIDSNTTPDSTNMSHRGGEIDQDVEQYQAKSPLLIAELFKTRDMVEKEKCVFNANHDDCITKFLKEVNSCSKVQSPKSRNNIKPTKRIPNVNKHKRWITKGYKVSPNQSSAVHEKPNTPRSCLRWKSTGRISRLLALGLIQNSVSLTTYVPPSNRDYEILFQPLFDEHFNPPPCALSADSVAVAAPRPIDPADSPSSTTIDQDVPSASTSLKNQEIQSQVTHQGKHVVKKTVVPENRLYTSSLLNAACKKSMNLLKKGLLNVQGRQNRGQGNNARRTGAVGNGGAQNKVRNVNPGQVMQIKCYNCNDKMLLMQAQENRVVLDEEQLLFIAGGQDNVVDEDVDEPPTMFMENLSSADYVYDEADPSYDSDILSEVHDHDNYQISIYEHHEVHEMHDDVQPNSLVDSDVEYTDDSNMISYDQYVKDNVEPVVQNNVSSIPNDAYMMIINEMHEQTAQCVSLKAQTKVVDASLTADLATYKEQVELYERRAKFELTKREQNIEEQLRIVITDRNIKGENLKKELHSVKMQINSTINHNKSMVKEVMSLKKEFKQKEKEILDMKALKEKVQINEKMKCVTMDFVKPKVLAPGMYAIDVEPIPLRYRNNREDHLDYLKHLKESVETLRKIVKEARVERPLDRSLASACL
nr:retrovirus-related Pol polyprotein from transposon TNT 1-94 [Tanacetum cinerariifolium]